MFRWHCRILYSNCFHAVFIINLTKLTKKNMVSLLRPNEPCVSITCRVPTKMGTVTIWQLLKNQLWKSRKIHWMHTVICNDKLVLQEKPKNHKQTLSGFCIMRYTCVLVRFHRNGSYSTSSSTRKNNCFSGIILIMPLVVYSSAVDRRFESRRLWNG